VKGFIFCKGGIIITRKARYVANSYIEYLKALVELQKRGYVIYDVEIEETEEKLDPTILRNSKSTFQDSPQRKYTLYLLKEFY